jgi:hypothetical protein
VQEALKGQGSTDGIGEPLARPRADAGPQIIPGLTAPDFGKLIVRPLQRRLRLRCRVTDGILGCLHQRHLCFELGTRDVLRG